MDLASPVGEAIEFDTYYLGVLTFLYDEGDYTRSVGGILRSWWEEAALSPRARRIVGRLLVALLGLNGQLYEYTLAEQGSDSEEASTDSEALSTDGTASLVIGTTTGEEMTPPEAVPRDTFVGLSPPPHHWPGRRYIDQVLRGV